jgi:hypothetical protein
VIQVYGPEIVELKLSLYQEAELLYLFTDDFVERAIAERARACPMAQESLSKYWLCKYIYILSTIYL